MITGCIRKSCDSWEAQISIDGQHSSHSSVAMFLSCTGSVATGPHLGDGNLFVGGAGCYNPTMTGLNEILIAAQSLPTTERAQLLAALWENVPPNEWVPPNGEWIAEANRRSDLLNTGGMSGSPWPDVRLRARRKAGLDG